MSNEALKKFFCPIRNAHRMSVDIEVAGSPRVPPIVVGTSALDSLLMTQIENPETDETFMTEVIDFIHNDLADAGFGDKFAFKMNDTMTIHAAYLGEDDV